MAKADMLFEVSWEICNKVGGIYTVVSSKVEPTQRNYGQRYILIGPYFYEKAKTDFIEEAPPDNLKALFSNLEQEGIKLHFGRWLTKGEPKTILIDFEEKKKEGNNIKEYLWNEYKIDSWETDFHDFDEPIIWAWCAGRVIEEYSNKYPEKRVVAHVHEWLSGATILYLKKNKPGIGTIFTTHATMLGRSLTTSGRDIYHNIKDIEPEKEARKIGIQAKHLTEVACAKNSHVFTTVSEITGIESEHFLGRKPDILLPNGLDIDSFPNFEELSIRHHQIKGKIQHFIMNYFFPYYTFDMEETLFIFILGRNEYKVKGIDLFTSSLGKLNEQMKKENRKKTIVAFYMIPDGVRGIKTSILESKSQFDDITGEIKDDLESIKNRIICTLMEGKEISDKSLFSKETNNELKRKLLRFHRQGTPPLSTHDLTNEKNQVISGFLHNGLDNSEEQRVKVVYYPIYLTGTDGLLDLDYYETIQGMQLGVFPSAYEPWGYTPLESGALGVPSITTDVAGFGRFIMSRINDSLPGINVIKRYNRTYEESENSLYNALHSFVRMNRPERVSNKMEAKRLSTLADWKILINNYIEAHDLATTKARP